MTMCKTCGYLQIYTKVHHIRLLAKDKMVMKVIDIWDPEEQREHNIINAASIKRDKDAGVWRILRQNAKDRTIEEMVFTITGAIFVTDIPPVMKETRKRRYHVHNQGDTSYGGKRVQGRGIRELETGYGDDELLFQTQKQFEQRGRKPIAANVDPVGVLAKIAQRKSIHTEENIVCYFRGGREEKIHDGKATDIPVSDTDKGIKDNILIRLIHRKPIWTGEMWRVCQLQLMRMKRKIDFEEDEDEDEYAGGR
ncbi:uncharacterized protein EV420DRAFT_1474800 [Desarmillaria tabescens]|uniref:Uncharacterized protein n=1 Tax=Armillaria tabescens TaxID=1929756 RepID=A0AA39NI02_ARMTA|nr:uncharacterized protein EV420DRAFT_1474800 [Desarmillaria tabescens]KAK0465984.1 hypothetical protein EV420DRAFT_1474800 [Desarmillaria tabescens]